MSDRAALFVFAAFVAVAFPLVLFELGSYHWFFRDDWFFITLREGDSLNDIFRPHNVHWSTVPVLAFRSLWQVFGLRSYVPYQGSVLLLHLTTVVLLRVIMRRAGVGPWLATAAAGSLVLFGPGSQNIVWAFQIGFTASLVFGLVHLLLADHGGGFDRRDGFGLGAGALSLMSSGIGVTMVIVVGVAVLLRRGWKAAALHTAPLAALYGLWALVIHPELSSPYGRPPFEAVVRWVRSGETATFLALGHFRPVAVALAVVLVVGLALACTPGRGRALRGRAAVPVALLVGAVVLPLITVQGRWIAGDQAARASRYLHLGAVFVLPALAVAADALARRWRIVTVPVVALFLIAVPSNAGDFGGFPFGRNYFDSEQQVLATAARMPFARQVPRDVRPIPDVFLSQGLTIGFLLDAAESGKLRTSSVDDPVAPKVVNEMRVRLGVAQRVTQSFPPNCRPVGRGLDLSPPKGTVYLITAPLTISTRDGTRETSNPVEFNPNNGRQLTIELADLRLRLKPKGPAAAMVCPGS